MEKKNFNKKSSKRVSNKSTDELTKKRYSKSKFKKDVREEQARQYVTEKKQTTTTKKREYKVEEKYQFAGSVIRTWYGILTKHSMQKKGYDFITKGQCIKVEEFNIGVLARISTNDGRVGITNLADIKRMSFAV
jgi:hypothetical protein